jgi:integrase/recombinase XerD
VPTKSQRMAGFWPAGAELGTRFRSRRPLPFRKVQTSCQGSSTLLDSYLRWWRMSGHADATGENYVRQLRRFSKTIGGEHLLPTAQRHQLEAYVSDRMSEVSPDAATYDVRAFKSFYGWLHAEGEVDYNPAAKLKHPKVDEPPVTVAVETDYRQMLAVCDRTSKVGRRNAAIIGMFWSTGMRRGELVGLDVDDVDLNSRTARIARTKTGKPRTVPLSDECIQLLDRWLRKRGSEPGPLILGRTGKRLSSNAVGQMFSNVATEAGVDVTSHSFRRALGTRWLAAGGSETGLQSVAGWTSTRMVARYTRMNAEELAQDEDRRLFG